MVQIKLHQAITLYWGLLNLRGRAYLFSTTVIGQTLHHKLNHACSMLRPFRSAQDLQSS